ncbi:MAG: hypothetical protein M1829_003166 [Trizodia sp. TS-e1964]|nr:MAG: hypothetical protein M1829_003166 [Trizodia sp. TS-e1964]
MSKRTTQSTKELTLKSRSPLEMAKLNSTSQSDLEYKFEMNDTPSPISEPEQQVRVVTMKELAPAALCLAQAFEHDHVARYFLDTKDMEYCTPAQKWKLHLTICESIVSVYIYRGLVTTIGPNYDSVALWMPPSATMGDWRTELRSGMWRLRYKLSREGKKRLFTEFWPLLSECKAEVMGARDRESWYLRYLGTKESSRGKGYASQLIKHVIDKADAENRACYLESSAGTNAGFYQKHGFISMRKLNLTRGETPIIMDIMVREPNY